MSHTFRTKEQEILKEMDFEEREHYLTHKEQSNRIKLMMLNVLDSISGHVGPYLKARNWYDQNITTEKKLDRLINILDELSRIRLLRNRFIEE